MKYDPLYVIVAGLITVAFGGMPQANAASVGHGTDLTTPVPPNPGWWTGDGNGGRGNVDVTSSVILGPGTYLASKFNVNVWDGGKATPFLAIQSPLAGATGNGTATDRFRILSTGAEQTYTIGDAGDNDDFVSRSYGGSSKVFTLTSPTKVFAGFTSNVSTYNPVKTRLIDYVFEPSTPQYLTDQWVPGNLINPVVGSDTTQPSGPGDYMYGRWYGFDIEVNSVQLGDFNLDGQVTNTDIQVMLNALTDLSAFKSANGLSDASLLAIGDMNSNGTVQNSDIQELLNRLTGGSMQPLSSLSIQSVPEPSSISLLIVSMFGFATLVRRRTA